MTTDEWQQQSSGGFHRSTDISIERIVNKDEGYDWQDGGRTCASGWLDDYTRENKESIPSLPSIQQLCVGSTSRSSRFPMSTFVEENYRSCSVPSNRDTLVGSQEGETQLDIQKEEQLERTDEDASSCNFVSVYDVTRDTRERSSSVEGQKSSQGSSSLNETSHSRASRTSDESCKVKKQMAKKLWRQKDQMRKEEERLVFQKKEANFQAAILEWLRCHSGQDEEQLRQIVWTQLFPNDANDDVKGMDQLPVFHGSAYDLITKQRHRIEKRLPPGSLEQLPEEEIRRRRNEQKSASKWRAMQLQMEKTHLLRWNCRLLEELYKYLTMDNQ
jgi:hypothetical protein